MRVELGHRGDYAVRAVLYLTRHPGRQRRQAIADAMAIPLDYLPQILGALAKAGVVRSTIGRNGGYELARPAERVTLREVIETAEGPLGSRKCVLRDGPCYWADKCAIHDSWAAAAISLAERLSATSFADLAMADWEIEQRQGSRSRRAG